jgi:hypothetical protein
VFASDDHHRYTPSFAPLDVQNSGFTMGLSLEDFECFWSLSAFALTSCVLYTLCSLFTPSWSLFMSLPRWMYCPDLRAQTLKFLVKSLLRELAIHFCIIANSRNTVDLNLKTTPST